MYMHVCVWASSKNVKLVPIFFSVWIFTYAKRTGPLLIPVPMKLFHNGGSGGWSPPCACEYLCWAHGGMKVNLFSRHARLLQSGTFITVTYLFSWLYGSSNILSGPFTGPLLPGWIGVCLHVRCIPQHNSQWQVWASVCVCCTCPDC